MSSRMVASYPSSSSAKMYHIYIADEGSANSHLYCDCIAWKMQKMEPRLRSCKHIRDYEIGGGKQPQNVFPPVPVQTEDDWEKELQQAAESLSRMMR